MITCLLTGKHWKCKLRLGSLPRPEHFGPQISVESVGIWNTKQQLMALTSANKVTVISTCSIILFVVSEHREEEICKSCCVNVFICEDEVTQGQQQTAQLQLLSFLSLQTCSRWYLRLSLRWTQNTPKNVCVARVSRVTEDHTPKLSPCWGNPEKLEKIYEMISIFTISAVIESVVGCFVDL